MTAEDKSNVSQKRPIRLCPWLVVLGALLLYGITLDHWVTLTSLPVISGITGWDWHPFPLAWRPTQVAPLFFVLTLPVRLLPVAWEPIALNILAAVWAALTLGLLAASVRLLPHDRTREQRQREGGEYALLSVQTAFLPALFAVLMMGLQLTFWRNAIGSHGEMLDLLVFAFLIFCLLKFRVSQNDSWLYVLAFVYGLGVTNNWALIGFFPFCLIAVVWIKGVNFFSWRFLSGAAGYGILGLSLYLLVPAIASLGPEHAKFWTMLHMELGAQSFGLRQVPRWVALVGALPTLLPLIFSGIRWPSFEGELSAAGNALTRFMFRLLHVVFLVLALVLFFDVKYSPSQRLQEVPVVGFLTFYYMGALCIGYFSGYMLLVFGKAPPQSWDRRNPATKAFNGAVVGAVWILAFGAPCALLWQNLPHITAGRNNALADYAHETIRDLPAKPAIILADDPTRLYLLEAAYQKEGKANNNILIDTGCLPHADYIAYLYSHYPALQKYTTNPTNLPNILPPDKLISYFLVLSQSFPIYYLQPSFGYYFEAFYLKPHGLVYELQPYPNPRESVEPPPLTAQEIKENQGIWAGLEKKSLATLPAEIKLDQATAMVGINFSIALDYWGVSLQKAGLLPEANALLGEAVKVNPQNFIAEINWKFNAHLQKGDRSPIDTGDLLFKAVTIYRGLVPILRYNGPVDESGLDLSVGEFMAEGKDLRQAAIMFDRRLQLLPGDPRAELDLAKTYVDWHRPDQALALVSKLRANPTINKWEVSRVEALAYYDRQDFATTETLLTRAVKEDPRDENRLAILAEFYRATAYGAMRKANEALSRTNKVAYKNYSDEATRRFNDSLIYINQELQVLAQDSQTSPDKYSIPDTLVKKAELEMMLKSFQAGVDTLNKVIGLEPTNATAVLNRAIAEVQINQFAAAKSDYKTLRDLMPRQDYVVDFGLADIAAREKDRPEEIRCLKRYLSSAPENTFEYKQVQQRLKKLEGP